ncbi:MAG: RHS repeat-associated core domain-containing protein, partial [Akkermansiaceae bacterium]|nr:RHS repeat-associated core domain-containing protein [Armatimonadota bacterium]
PTSYSTNSLYSVGFGGQFGYYVENNTKLASGDPRDRGLILATHRYHDPINPRWLTRDPIGYDGDINLYGYVQSNPVMNTDPSGLAKIYICFRQVWQPAPFGTWCYTGGSHSYLRIVDEKTGEQWTVSGGPASDRDPEKYEGKGTGNSLCSRVDGRKEPMTGPCLSLLKCADMLAD